MNQCFCQYYLLWFSLCGLEKNWYLCEARPFKNTFLASLHPKKPKSHKRNFLHSAVMGSGAICLKPARLSAGLQLQLTRQISIVRGHDTTVGSGIFSLSFSKESDIFLVLGLKKKPNHPHFKTLSVLETLLLVFGALSWSALS